MSAYITIILKYPLRKSSVAVKDASENKKNENTAKVPITKVQKKVRLMRVILRSILDVESLMLNFICKIHLNSVYCIQYDQVISF